MLSEKRKRIGWVELRAGIASLRRLNSFEKAEELEAIYRKYPVEFRPVSCDEKGKVPFRSWPDGLQHIIRGEANRAFNLGKPLSGYVTVFLPRRVSGDMAHSLTQTVRYEPLVELGLFDKWRKLFEELVAWAGAEYAYVMVRSQHSLMSPPPEERRVEYAGIEIHSQGTSMLRPWLADIYWLNVWGPHYQDFFGLDRLTQTDAFSTWEDSGGRIWMQLCETPEEAHTEEGVRRKERIKEQLGVPNAFISPDLQPDPFGQSTEGFSSPNFDRSELEVPDYPDEA